MAKVAVYSCCIIGIVSQGAHTIAPLQSKVRIYFCNYLCNYLDANSVAIQVVGVLNVVQGQSQNYYISESESRNEFMSRPDENTDKDTYESWDIFLI